MASGAPRLLDSSLFEMFGLSSSDIKELGYEQVKFKELDPQDVRQEISKRSRAIFDSWNQLNHILKSHEAVIQKRWISKTASKRREVLLNAWPNMSPSHRPELEAFLKEPKQQRKTATRFADAYMFPRVNLEDLSKPRPLLLLLNSRGRTQPHVFSMADHQTMTFAFATGTIFPGLLNDYHMAFCGRTTPEKYGELETYNMYTDPLGEGFGRHDMSPGFGLQVLRIQDRLLEFLVKCCKGILHDVDFQVIHPSQPEPPLPRPKHVLSLLDEKLEDEYRLPSEIDLASLDSLFTAKLESCEAHFVALREDPAYFADTMLQCKEHRLELLPDNRGQPHPSQAPHRQHAFWADVLQEVVNDAHLWLETWTAVHERLSELRTVHAKYAGSLSTERQLPEELLMAFLRFDYHLDLMGQSITRELMNDFAASPSIRNWFLRCPDQDALSWSGGTNIQAKPDLHSCPIRKKCFYLVQNIWDEERASTLGGRELLVDELEHFLQEQPAARNLLSAQIEHVLSDLGIIAQAKHQIKLFQPWASTFHLVSKGARFDKMDKQFDKRTEGLWQIMETSYGPAVADLALPSSGKFAYPSHKRRSAETVAVMRQSEHHLDTLWKAIDQRIVPLVDRYKQLSGLRRFLGRQGSLKVDRTPAWLPCSPQKTKSSLRDPQSGLLAGQSLADYYHDLERRSQANNDPNAVGTSIPRDAKIKTRGQPSTSPLPPTADAIIHPQAKTTYAVPAKAHKVFRTIFFSPNVSSQPGEVAWNDFVEAMQSVGFDAQQRQGSSWQFIPRADSGLEKSILFHQPHPSPKLPFWWARFYGRRLSKTFGWDVSTFTQK